MNQPASYRPRSRCSKHKTTGIFQHHRKVKVFLFFGQRITAGNNSASQKVTFFCHTHHYRSRFSAIRITTGITQHHRKSRFFAIRVTTTSQKLTVFCHTHHHRNNSASQKVTGFFAIRISTVITQNHRKSRFFAIRVTTTSQKLTFFCHTHHYRNNSASQKVTFFGPYASVPE